MTSATLRGKVVLVTGAARRLGRIMAEALARDGAAVAVHHHSSPEAATELVRALSARGDTPAQAFRADLRNGDQAAALPNQVVERMGRLDVLINSAAVMVRQPFGSVTPAMWDDVMNLNLRAYFLVAQAAAPHLRATRGRMVNISDVAAFDVWPGYLPHCVSKAGVEMLTRGLARVLAPEVMVNGIAPGPVLLAEGADDTENARAQATIPLRRLGAPDDVVRALRYLMSAEFVTGTTLVVDGGQMIRARAAT